MVDVVQLLEHREDGRARPGDDVVGVHDRVDFAHDTLGLGRFCCNLRSFILERLKRLDNIFVVENVAARVVESLE